MLIYGLKNVEIAVIGLGYVGLPLAVEFGKKYKTIGFDINQTRIDELNNGYDRTRETSGLKYNEGFYCGYSPERLNLGHK